VYKPGAMRVPAAGLPISKPQLVIERRPVVFISRPSLGLPPSDLPHRLHLSRREVESRLGFTNRPDRPEAVRRTVA
jgi:hypothetical protein